MEGHNKAQKEQECWMSPEEVFTNPSAQREMTSTPNLGGWQPLVSHFGDSESSSKVDSGYSSSTPYSRHSLSGIFSKNCRVCGQGKNYVQSTPDCTSCICENNHSYENKTPQTGLGYPGTTTSKSTMSLCKPISTLVKHISPLEYFDEAMESSLYEMEVEQSGLEETQDVNLGSMEIGEEKSIDFLDSGVCLQNSQMGTTNESESGNKLYRKEQDSEEFFSPEADMSTGVCNSPKASNETTPRKVKKSGAFKTVAKKVHNAKRFLGSFSLNGIEEVDFLFQLGVKRNFSHVISTILSFLSDKELDSVRAVSKTWNKVFHNDEVAFKRWKAYNSAMKMKMENYWSPSKARSSAGRLTLFNITNHNSPSQEVSPRRSPPVSPEKLRFHSYRKMGRVLKMGERLLPCPKCNFPTRDRGSPNAHCTRSGCCHRFCVWCRYETTADTEHNCPTFTPHRRPTSKGARVGSKASKRNLRRLL